MLFGYHRLTKLYLVIVPVLFEIISNVLAESSALPRKLSLPEKSALSEKSLEKSEVTKTPAPISLYHYEYHIHDSNSGDYKSQEESHDGERVIGSYRVADPDGYLRIVNYTADIKNGFRADVHFHRDGSPTTKPQAKVNRTVNHLRNHNYRSNFTPFTPSKPRYVNAVTPSSPVRLTNTAPSRRGVPPAHFESVKNHGSLKTLELQPNWSTIRQESKHIENKEPRTEKDSVVIEMHLNDGSSSDEKSPEVPPNIEKNVKQPTIEPESNKNPALQDIMKVAPEITTKTIENAMSVPIPMPIEIPKIAEEMKAQNSTKVVGMTEESKLDGVPNFTKVVSMSEMLKPEATKIVGESDLLKPEATKVAGMSEEIKPEATRVVGMEEEMRPEATKAVEKAAHDRIKVEVEQIIMDRLHAPTSSSSVHEELKKEAALADKDLRGIQNTNIMNNGEGRSNTALNTDTSNTESKEELHISVHQNTRIDEAAKNRAQKKYSTLPRPLRLVEQVPVGNYQLQTLTEPTASMTPSENSNGYNYNTNGNSNSYNYNTQGNNDGYYNTNSNSNGYYNTNGNNNFYYDPTLAATVGNFYGNQPGITHINSNSLKPQMYDQYPAESQQYAIGYEWIKMNPRMVNTNNGESYIIMDPDYSSYSTGGKTLFGIPQPTLPHKPTFHNTYFHNWLTKNKPKPHSEPIKPNVDQTPAASTIKEPNVMDQKNAPVPLPLPITRNQQVINADNSPKHDQQIPMYFKKEQEKSTNPEPVRDGGGSSKQNLTQKYLESLQAVPFPYQMEVIKVPPPSGVIKQLPVIQPAAINPIPAYTWPTGPVAINPAIAFILLPLQPAQDPPVQPIIVN